jgi:threonine/homoserine/homoserine lactone efflux protein
MTLFSFVSLFITGIGLGLLISAPVGPVNVLCIQHSLQRGFFGGLAIGAGALLADLFIAGMAAFGISALSGFMKSQETLVQIVGGFILALFGMRLFLSHPHWRSEECETRRTVISHLGALPQSFLLTVTNPGAILGIFAVIGSAGSAVGGLANILEALALLGGVGLGALIWWISLARIVSAFRQKLSDDRLRLINQVAGGLLIVCAIALFLKVGFW